MMNKKRNKSTVPKADDNDVINAEQITHHVVIHIFIT